MVLPSPPNLTSISESAVPVPSYTFNPKWSPAALDISPNRTTSLAEPSNICILLVDESISKFVVSSLKFGVFISTPLVVSNLT